MGNNQFKNKEFTKEFIIVLLSNFIDPKIAVEGMNNLAPDYTIKLDTFICNKLLALF